PVIGPTSYDNLWLSTGHGTLGWTMAAGSGALLSDWIGGRQLAIATDGLLLSRYK
ncbi:MAG: FAD-dependent oxidoreductase, partial [Betaproteobacteria bacterium]